MRLPALSRLVSRRQPGPRPGPHPDVRPGPLARFAADEGGSISVEAILMLPLLAWTYLGTYVFFDGFAAQDTNIKAAYTIGDILSRQTDWITPEFLDSLYELQDVLTDTPESTALRVTTFEYDEGADQLVVIWSKTRGAGPAELTNATLATRRSFVPVLADEEVAVLVETWMEYTPPMDIGLEPLTFQEVVVTRPRFALNGRFCYNSMNDNGTPATETC